MLLNYKREVYNMKEIFLNVKGMMCEGCENRVKTVIKNIEGVKEVSANNDTYTGIYSALNFD